MVRIVDASVAIKWFIEENGRESALQILRNIVESPGEFAVPELFYFELAHVFNRVIPRPTETQVKLLVQLSTLGMHRFSMTPEWLREIRSFQKMGLSGYDAAYVALAKMTKGKWITFDHKAHALVKSLSLSELMK